MPWAPGGAQGIGPQEAEGRLSRPTAIPTAIPTWPGPCPGLARPCAWPGPCLASQSCWLLRAGLITYLGDLIYLCPERCCNERSSNAKYFKKVVEADI